MNHENPSPDNESANQETWPRRLNKMLIGIGVVAFGLIIADRLVDMFQADDMPVTTEIVRDSDTPPVAVAQPVKTDIVEEVAALPDESEDLAALPDESDATENVLNIEDVFGSRLVFVSALEPVFVVTENERRINVHEAIDDDTTLHGISGQSVIVDRGGNLLPVKLPDLAVK